MRKLLVGVVVLGLASMALADATVDYGPLADLGGGLYGVTLTAHGNDALQLSFFTDTTIAGEDGAQIQQVKSIIVPGTLEYDINSETEADTYEGLGGYAKATDSWLGDPFYESPANVVALTGDQPGDNVYHVEAGTGGGSAFEDAKLAYIASTAGRLHCYGSISRSGSSFPYDFYIVVPEPATLLLLVAGAGLALRRRR
jgi:hypothetical protein